MSVRSVTSALPAVVVALLPRVACPSCWPAYAGVLSSLGLTFLMREAVMRPLVLGSLGLALLMLAFRASRRRGYGPLLLGLGAAAAIYLGRFTLEQPPLLYSGALSLVGASLWNAWPPKRARNLELFCPKCEAWAGIPEGARHGTAKD